MANGYIHKVFRIPDLFDFSYSYNDARLDITPFVGPYLFANFGIFLKSFSTLNSFSEIDASAVALVCKLDQDSSIPLDIKLYMENKKVRLDIKGPISEHEERAKVERKNNSNTKGVGSLISRAIRATATLHNNFFLHANGVYDPVYNTFFIVASEKDAAGKSAIVNELLRENNKCVLFSNSLRVSCQQDNKYVLYPQGFGDPSGYFYNLLRQSEERMLKERGKELRELGFEAVDAAQFPIGSNYKLLKVKSQRDPLDVSADLRLCAIFPEGVATREGEPGTFDIKDKDGQDQIIASLKSHMLLDKQPMYGIMNGDDIDRSIIEITNPGVQRFERFAGRINYFYKRQATPDNIWTDVFTRMYVRSISHATATALNLYPPTITDIVRNKLDAALEDIIKAATGRKVPLHQITLDKIATTALPADPPQPQTVPPTTKPL